MNSDTRPPPKLLVPVTERILDRNDSVGSMKCVYPPSGVLFRGISRTSPRPPLRAAWSDQELYPVTSAFSCDFVAVLAATAVFSLHRIVVIKRVRKYMHLLVVIYFVALQRKRFLSVVSAICLSFTTSHNAAACRTAAAPGGHLETGGKHQAFRRHLRYAQPTNRFEGVVMVVVVSVF